MRTFKDSEGREWRLSMNIGQARRLKDRLGLDVLDGGKSLTDIATNPYTTANALYVLCESQATAEGVTDEQFGASLAGDVIDAATVALQEEMIDFFPKRQREALRTMLANLFQVQEQGAAMAVEKIQGAGMQEAIQRALKETSQQIDKLLAGESSGNSQAP